MIDFQKMEKIIAALSVSMEAMNASTAEATYAFAFLHQDAMKRFMVERVWDEQVPKPKNIVNATAISQFIEAKFAALGNDIDTFADDMVGPQIFSEGSFFIEPDSELMQ